jgi:hypothetical protein
MERRAQMFQVARSEAAQRRPHWDWVADGVWRYARPDRGWYARITITDTGFAWSLRSKRDSAELAAGDDQTLAGMYRRFTAYDADTTRRGRLVR